VKMLFPDDEEAGNIAKGVLILVGLACISVGVGSYFGVGAGFGLFGAIMFLSGIFAK
jgi:hypothetical protein